MKKIISALFVVVLLVSCSSKSINNTYLYEMANDSNTPFDINVYDEETNTSYSFNQEEDVKEIIDLFKNILIKKESDSPSAYCFSITFEYENGEYDGYYFYDNTIEIYDDNGDIKYYELEGYQELHDLLKEKMESAYLPLNQSEIIIDHEGISVSQESCYKDGDNYILSLYANNHTDKDIYLKVEATVNDFNIHSYQTMGIFADNSVGYDVAIPTAMLSEYGINNIGKIDYVVYLFEADIENSKKGELLYKSDSINILNNADFDSEVIKDSVAYNDNGINVYVKYSEADINTNLYLFIENENNEDVVLSILNANINGEEQSYEIEDSFKVNLDANSNKFLLLPLYNYIYDETNQSVKKYDINSLTINTDLIKDNGTNNIDIVLK